MVEIRICLGRFVLFVIDIQKVPKTNTPKGTEEG